MKLKCRKGFVRIFITIILHAGGTWGEECAEQLLLLDSYIGIAKFCPKTNESKLVSAASRENTFRRFSYSPRNGGTIVALNSTNLITFSQINSNETSALRKTVIDLPRRICPSQNFEEPFDVAIDWKTDVVYFTYFCGKIVAYDWKRSLHTTVYEDDNKWAIQGFIVTYPQKRLLIWSKSKSMHRALADGTEVKTLQQFEGSFKIGSLAVDYQTSLVYWTDYERYEIFQCDLDGKGRRRLNLSLKQEPRAIAVHGGVMYWQERTTLYRAHVQEATKKIIIKGGLFNKLRIFPITSILEEPTRRPCSNNSCSYICVQSSKKGYTCLCSDDNVLRMDGHSCEALRHLLISTSAGIFQVPVLNGVALPERKSLPFSTSEPSHLQCDNSRDRLYWAEGHDGSTRIMRADMNNLEKNPEMVFRRDHLSIRYPTEELQAFALDHITSNLYMVFRGQRRILACTDKNNVTTTENKCTELFGNKVAASVGGLALDDEGSLYWTENNDDEWAVIVGYMSGFEHHALRNRRCNHPTSIAVVEGLNEHIYWIDSLTNRIEQTNRQGSLYRPLFEPSKFGGPVLHVLVVNDGQLYGAGTTASSEAIFSTGLTLSDKLGDWNVTYYSAANVTRVSGLSMQDKKPKRNKRYKRNNPCEDGNSCAGVCLLSTRFSATCRCRIGFQSDNSNGSSCKERAKPVIIYGAKVVNENSVTGVTRKMRAAVAFDPVKREIFSFLDSICWREKDRTVEACLTEDSGTIGATAFQDPGSELTFVNASDLLKNFRFDVIATSMEYDWIGENFYFTAVEAKGVVVCSKEGECAVVVTTEFLKILKVALDPPSRRMYWTETYFGGIGFGASKIYSGNMDGTNKTLILDRGPFSRAVFDLQVDQTSRLLFWAEQVSMFVEEHVWEILRSDMDAKNIKLTVALNKMPVRIRIAGNRLFWISADDGSIASCEKETCDGLVTHALRDLDTTCADFLVIAPNSSIKEAERDPCITGALCSHICVPTPAGYMRCLCPHGYKLQANGWTCECEVPEKCSTPQVKGNNEGTGRRPQSDFPSRRMRQMPCPGNSISCSGECVDVEHVCDGIPDCADYSDEGERCNEVCVNNNGCSKICKSTPKGPACFCPPEQVLDEDQKGCMMQIQMEAGKVGLTVSGVLGLVLVIVIVFGTIKYRRTKRKLRNLTDQEVEEFLQGDPTSARTAPDGLDRALSLPYTHVLPPNDIIRATETVLGSGEFGVVHPGICKSNPVAIKSLKRSVDVDEFKAVLAELKIMAYMGDHAFIVKFVGAEISEIANRKLMIVTELSPHGDLLRYLWKVRQAGLKTEPAVYENVAGGHAEVTTLTLCKWCEQIAAGMEYLTQKQIVHGDLAARNVLVFQDYVVKITDFGLSKQLYGCSQYQSKKQCKLPWKWAATELLTSMEFSERSDVWAFGVTAWEIFSLGETPYKGMAFSHEFIQYLQAGNRLPKPEHASDEIYNILLECWSGETSARPDFCRLKQFFHALSLVEMRVTGSGFEVGNNDVESYYTTAV